MILSIPFIIAVSGAVLFGFLLLRFNEGTSIPKPIVFFCFLYGAIGAVTLSLLNYSFSGFLLSTLVNDLERVQVFIAPFIEEPMKSIALLVVFFNNRFSKPSEGFYFGSMVGLGFGMTENFLYFIGTSNAEQLFVLIFIRTFFSMLIHCIASSFIGAGLSYYLYSNSAKRKYYPVLGLLAAITIHFLWNFVVILNYFGHTFLILLIFYIYVFIYILILRNSMKKEKKVLFLQLNRESQLGLIPDEHIVALSYFSKDAIALPKGELKDYYIEMCHKLAFKNNQLQYNYMNQELYKEIETLREKIKFILLYCYYR